MIGSVSISGKCHGGAQQASSKSGAMDLGDWTMQASKGAFRGRLRDRLAREIKHRPRGRIRCVGLRVNGGLAPRFPREGDGHPAFVVNGSSALARYRSRAQRLLSLILARPE